MKKLGCFFDFRVIVIHDLKLRGFLCGGKFLFHIRVGIGQDILDGAVHIGADNGLAGNSRRPPLERSRPRSTPPAYRWRLLGQSRCGRRSAG